ncbi:MAG TPA: SUMF1/EgtB/PvdO family nonheme iron enzyme, partial [Candidatus Binatia bacterium]|nr:SUMF1/EgtB/PvdO family nonheme iron enzyme [Candidatus Binatia bacterium]
MIGPDIVTIPGGWFLMGSMHGPENEQPCHRVWVDSFGIGRFPITNHEYKKIIDGTQKQPPPFWLDPIFSNPEQPVVGVSW